MLNILTTNWTQMSPEIILRQLNTLLIPTYMSHYSKYDNLNNLKLITC